MKPQLENQGFGKDDGGVQEGAGLGIGLLSGAGCDAYVTSNDGLGYGTFNGGSSPYSGSGDGPDQGNITEGS